MVVRANSLKGMALVAGLAMASAGLAQGQTLTLTEALDRARTNNGTVRAAFLNLEAAQANVGSSFSAFLPTLTARAERDIRRTERFTGFRGTTNDTIDSAFLDLNYRLLDNGSRRFTLDRARANALGSEADAYDTLRGTLFTVTNRFYDALRASELLTVQQRALERAQTILDQTRRRANPPIEDVPRKDVFQAEADFQNTRVAFLAAKRRVSTTQADLRAVIAWSEGDLPKLEDSELTLAEVPADAAALVKAGLERRFDLLSLRQRVRAQQITVRSVRAAGGLTYNIDLSYRRQMAEDALQSAALTFSAALPLYDGKSAREETRAAQLNLQAVEANLAQQERVARAEIEATYEEVLQNAERQEAAQAALKAAQVNFDAAVSAQSKGAGTLIEVLTAQVTLATAESNAVEARFDLKISQIRLRLVTGAPLPGEPNLAG